MEIDAEVLDELPEWKYTDSNAEGRMAFIQNYIEANLTAGYPMEWICAQLIHPATGKPPTASQLRASFPDACLPGAGVMRITAELYTTALHGDRGDKMKAIQMILERQATEKWGPLAKKIELTGKDGKAIEVKHRVESAMDKAVSILDAIATRKVENGDNAKDITKQVTEEVDDGRTDAERELDRELEYARYEDDDEEPLSAD